MTPRTVVITGASDGIGAAAARALAAAGDRVVVVGRSPEKTAAVAESLGADHLVADFSRLSDVRRLAADLSERYPTIDVLANNAGGLFGRASLTEDGFEQTMQVNHLAPFLLTHLLMDTLRRSRATVVTTSSAAARQGRLTPAAVDKGVALGGFRAYGNSKLANVLFTFGLHRRFHAAGISAATFHPGVVATNFSASSGGPARWLYLTPMARLLLTPEQGADTLVWLAQGTPGRDWTPGGYFEKRREARTNPQAYDEDLIARFWDRSAEVLGL